MQVKLVGRMPSASNRDMYKNDTELCLALLPDGIVVIQQLSDTLIFLYPKPGLCHYGAIGRRNCLMIASAVTALLCARQVTLCAT
jgi:hypothetical protein